MNVWRIGTLFNNAEWDLYCRFFYLLACLSTKTNHCTPELFSIQRQCNMFSEQNNNTIYSVSNKHSASIKIKQCHPQAQLCQKSNLIWRIVLRCAVDHMCRSEIWAVLLNTTSGVVLWKQLCHRLFLRRLSAVAALTRGLFCGSRQAKETSRASY